MTLLQIIFGLIMGGFTSRLATRKGRSPFLWFALGAFFGIIPLIILGFLSPNRVLVAEGKAPSTSPTINAAPSTASPSSLPPFPLWYFLDKEKKEQGPMSFYALQEAWNREEINDSTYVWNENLENWERIKNLPDLSIPLANQKLGI